MSNYCPYCFGDRSLVRQLELARPQFPDDNKCDFHPTRKAIPGEYLVGLFDRVIRDNFGWAETNPYFQNGISLEDVIYEIAAPDEHDVVRQIIDDLIEADDYDPRDGGEAFYADDQNYDRYEGHYNPHHSSWERFKGEVLHRRRFLSSEATRYLQEIFSDIHLQKDKGGKPAVYMIEPGNDAPLMYRARRIDEPEKRNEAIEKPSIMLGTPPAGSRRANRMNAAGIPAFYGAFDMETCVAEIRPPVGCIVVGTAFELLRQIVVLDTTRFAKPILQRSIFSPVYRERQDQWQFMQSFMHEISRPVLPNDETIEYIPTQVVSEFIHADLKVKVSGKDRQIDGIIFQSAQHPAGRNIVLFGSAAEVEAEPTNDPKPASKFSGPLETWGFDNPFGSENACLRSAPERAVQLRISSVSFQSETHVEYSLNDDF